MTGLTCLPKRKGWQWSVFVKPLPKEPGTTQLDRPDCEEILREAPPNQGPMPKGSVVLHAYLSVLGTAVAGFLLLFALDYSVPVFLSSTLIAVSYWVPRRSCGPRRRARLFANATLHVLVSLLIAMSLGEFAVRWLAPVPDRLYIPDPKYIMALLHASHGVQYFAQDDGTQGPYEVTISSQGLRDTEYPHKREGEIRIAMIGDSFTMGNGLGLEETIPKQLEELLRKQFPGRLITVINGGCGGYGPWQSLGMLQDRVMPLDPDMVILQLLPANDLSDTLLKHGEVLPAFNYLDSVFRFLAMQHFDNWKVRAELTLQHTSKLSKLLFIQSEGDISLARLLNSFRFDQAQVVFPDRPPVSRPYYLEVQLREWYPQLERAFGEFMSDISSIARYCNEEGIPLLVFTVPNGINIRDSAWEQINHDPKLSGLYESNKDIRVTEEYLASEGIHYVSLLQPFLNHPGRNDFYYKKDGHFTREGAAATAVLLAEHPAVVQLLEQ